MELLEYQAKELFQQVGIPILPSQAIANPSQLKRLQIPYPVVLKSQVRAGGRGKAGGVRFAANTIDAIAAAHAIFSLPIGGEYPEVLLAEARYRAIEEFFLAVVLDYQLQKPVLLGSIKGGMDVETLLQNTHKVFIDEQFAPFHARKLAVKMGLKGSLLQSVSVILEKMYDLFKSKDLNIVEINPLGINAEGQVMALDGKITVNDHALGRHPDLLQLISSPEKNLKADPLLNWLCSKPRPGNIAVICNSYGLALNTWDLLIQEQGKPSCCLILDEYHLNLSIAEQLKTGLETLFNYLEINVILVNILGSPLLTQAVTQGIIDQFSSVGKTNPKNQGDDRMLRGTSIAALTQERISRSNQIKLHRQPPQLILRLNYEGDKTVELEKLSLLGVHWQNSTEDAVKQAINLTQK
ncbi:ATP-grasp domain-containing protein [Chroococcus sp. FPU101]|uniref:ATP-grasp domain-containing protein n=1 Tax=Chroococcus sp. FPU101 TaxID=1974212 RepID=UPI001A901E92|nr:ATP-grasp domain-containing protein [Chroococcus sp. FPU101]GFE69800.1 ATP-grasp domain protein [Chroococcus sp. FPU101]